MTLRHVNTICRKQLFHFGYNIFFNKCAQKVKHHCLRNNKNHFNRSVKDDDGWGKSLMCVNIIISVLCSHKTNHYKAFKEDLYCSIKICKHRVYIIFQSIPGM